MTKQTIEITRGALEEGLAKLRQQRGEAMLDGKKFDNSKVAAAEAELAAFADAQAERIRRQREMEAKDAEVNLQRKIKTINKLEADRQRAWSDLEAATRSMLQAIGRVKSSTESQRVLFADVTAAVPMDIGPFETAHKIRGRVGEFLHAAKVGFEVPGAGGIYARALLEDWKEAERAAMAPKLAGLA